MFNLKIIVMFFSRIKSSAPCAVSKVSTPRLIDKIDNFVNSEFFFDDNGLEICDAVLLDRCQNNPELSEKVQKQIVVHDVQGFDPSVDNDTIFKQLDTRYQSQTAILKSIRSQIGILRQEQSQESA